MLLPMKITIFYVFTFRNVIYSCDGKAEFWSALPWFDCNADLVLKKHFLLLFFTFLRILRWIQSSKHLCFM